MPHMMAIPHLPQKEICNACLKFLTWRNAETAASVFPYVSVSCHSGRGGMEAAVKTL